MAGAERVVGLDIVLVQQVAQAVLAKLDAVLFADAGQDVAERVKAGVAYLDLVADAPQKGLVHQVAGLEVGGKDDEHLKGDLDLEPGVQRQIVVAFLQRHHPAVEQVAGAHLLPAKVVDEEHAAVGLHLERCLIVLGDVVPHQVQRLQRQLAAGHDHRPRDADPAPVGAGADRLVVGRARRLPRHGPVVELVKDLDDHAPHLDGKGHKHLAAQHHLAQALGHDRLAVARRAVEKDRAPGIDRRPQHLQHLGVDHQVGEGVAQIGFVGGGGQHRLTADAGAVVGQRHRRRTHVLAAVQHLAGAGDAFGRDGVLVGRAPKAASALDLAHLVALQELEHLVHDPGKGQTHLLGHFGARDIAPEVEELEGQV